MSKIYVIPKEGMMVPDPRAKGKKSSEVRLPAEGKLVEDSTYWQRRLRDGDVSLGSQAPVAVIKPQSAGAKSAKAGE